MSTEYLKESEAATGTRLFLFSETNIRARLVALASHLWSISLITGRRQQQQASPETTLAEVRAELEVAAPLLALEEDTVRECISFRERALVALPSRLEEEARERRRQLIAEEAERLRPRPLTSAEATSSAPDSRERTIHRVWPADVRARIQRAPIIRGAVK